MNNNTGNAITKFVQLPMEKKWFHEYNMSYLIEKWNCVSSNGGCWAVWQVIIIAWLKSGKSDDYNYYYIKTYTHIYMSFNIKQILNNWWMATFLYKNHSFNVSASMCVLMRMSEFPWSLNVRQSCFKFNLAWFISIISLR